MSVIEPEPWWPLIGMLLILAMSTELPLLLAALLFRTLAGLELVTARWPQMRPETDGSRPEAARNSSVARIAAVDEAGLDVAAAAAVRSATCGSWRIRFWSCSLLISRIWPIVGFLAPGPKNGFDAGGAVDRGRLEQLPAVEDRLGVDLRRVLAGGLDHELHVGGGLRVAGAIRPRIVPATTTAPALSGWSVYWFLARCRTSEK